MMCHGEKGRGIMQHIFYGGAVAEWVRALDWRPDDPGFEFRCGNLYSIQFNCFIPDSTV